MGRGCLCPLRAQAARRTELVLRFVGDVVELELERIALVAHRVLEQLLVRDQRVVLRFDDDVAVEAVALLVAHSDVILHQLAAACRDVLRAQRGELLVDLRLDRLVHLLLPLLVQLRLPPVLGLVAQGQLLVELRASHSGRARARRPKRV